MSSPLTGNTLNPSMSFAALTALTVTRWAFAARNHVVHHR